MVVSVLPILAPERFFLVAYRLGGGMSSRALVESADTLHLA